MLRSDKALVRLSERLGELRDGAVDEVGADGLLEVAADLMVCLVAMPGEAKALSGPAAELGALIERSRGRANRIDSGAVNDLHVPAIIDDLASVVATTEVAANQIMGIAEELQSIAGDSPQGLSDPLNRAAAELFETCSFQDLSGQRVARIAAALEEINARCDELIAALGGDHCAGALSRARARRLHPPAPADEAGMLLNGPQNGGAALSQDAIDALMGD